MQQAQPSLKKLIVITGASSGIGAATAKFLSSYNYPLLLLSRRLNKMQELKLPNALCLECDITNYQQVKNCIEQGEQLYGKVDCLINSVGLAKGGDPAQEGLEEWNEMIDVNCKGVLNSMKVVLEGMKERKEGTIINIGSLAGKKTYTGVSVYCGTKFFLHAVTENIREEMAQYNVRICLIAPGPTDTDMCPEALKQFEPLDPKTIAENCKFIYEMPKECCIREIVIAPTKFPF